MLSTVHEPPPPISVARAAGPGLGAAFLDDEGSDGAAEKAGGGGGAGAEAREIPSLRPGIKVG